jgi:hypothetical protein
MGYIYREKLTNISLGTGGISVLNGITGNKILFHLAVSSGVALGIVGSVQASATNPTKGVIFRKISIIIFLVLTVFLLYRCFLLYRREKIGVSKPVHIYILVSTVLNFSKPRVQALKRICGREIRALRSQCHRRPPPDPRSLCDCYHHDGKYGAGQQRGFMVRLPCSARDYRSDVVRYAGPCSSTFPTAPLR